MALAQEAVPAALRLLRLPWCALTPPSRPLLRTFDYCGLMQWPSAIVARPIQPQDDIDASNFHSETRQTLSHLQMPLLPRDSLLL